MKNKYNVLRLIGLLILAVGILLVVLGVKFFELDSSTNIGMIVGASGIVVIILGAIWYKDAKNASRRICNHCGSKMKGCEYTYNIVKTIEPSSPNAKGYDIEVEIIAYCPDCGKEKMFTKKFHVPYNSNPQLIVDRFCRDKFGN